MTLSGTASDDGAVATVQVFNGMTSLGFATVDDNYGTLEFFRDFATRHLQPAERAGNGSKREFQ